MSSWVLSYRSTTGESGEAVYATRALAELAKRALLEGHRPTAREIEQASAGSTRILSLITSSAVVCEAVVRERKVGSLHDAIGALGSFMLTRQEREALAAWRELSDKPTWEYVTDGRTIAVLIGALARNGTLEYAQLLAQEQLRRGGMRPGDSGYFERGPGRRWTTSLNLRYRFSEAQYEIEIEIPERMTPTLVEFYWQASEGIYATVAGIITDNKTLTISIPTREFYSTGFALAFSSFPGWPFFGGSGSWGPQTAMPAVFGAARRQRGGDAIWILQCKTKCGSVLSAAYDTSEAADLARTLLLEGPTNIVSPPAPAMLSSRAFCFISPTARVIEADILKMQYEDALRAVPEVLDVGRPSVGGLSPSAALQTLAGTVDWQRADSVAALRLLTGELVRLNRGTECLVLAEEAIRRGVRPWS